MNKDSNEKQRIESVNRFLQIDFNKKEEFQNIVELAAQLCDKPIALITLLDEGSNWLKVRYGVDVEVMPRESAFCKYAIHQDDILIIPDARKDQRFDTNELVHHDPNVRFYAGAPLILDSGLKVGTLCLFDLKPNSINELQQKALTILSKQVVFLMELELSHKLLELQIEETDAKNESLRKIAYIQSHDIRQPLTSIMGLVGLIKDGHHPVDELWLGMIGEATNLLDTRIRAIVIESMGSKDFKALRFNKMVEEIEDYAILLLDNDGNIENWNKGAEKLKGYKSEEILGKNFSIFYAPEDIENGIPKLLIEQAARDGSSKSEGWRVRKNGTQFWGRVVITAIHDDENDVIGFTKVTRDLSDMK